MYARALVACCAIFCCNSLRLPTIQQMHYSRIAADAVPRVHACLPFCRYDVLQEMLEVLRDHQNNGHMSQLEWIVIILIALAVSITTRSQHTTTCMHCTIACFTEAYDMLAAQSNSSRERILTHILKSISHVNNHELRHPWNRTLYACALKH